MVFHSAHDAGSGRPQDGRASMVALLIITLVGLAGAVLVLARPRAVDRLPITITGPAPKLRAAMREYAAGHYSAAATLSLGALEAAPWYGPGWAIAAEAVQHWLGLPAAIPYARVALWLDPSGRSTIRAVAPLLLKGGALSVTDAAELLIRTGLREIAEALPPAPPADWPNAMRRNLSPAAAEALLVSQHQNWLRTYAAHPRARELDPAAQTWVLRAQCSDLQRCLGLVTACAEKLNTCPRGAYVDLSLALDAARSAIALHHAEMAVAWARRALALRPAARQVADIADVLRAAGRAQEASLILRTHPALAGAR